MTESDPILEEASKIVQQVGLPPKPEVLLKVREELNRPMPDIDAIEVEAQKDISIAGRIIKMANSSLFGGRVEITSIAQAFVRLGLTNFKQVIYASAARAASKDLPEALLDRVWSHAEEVAVACHMFADDINPARAEGAYLLGLFHDCGTMMLLDKDPDYEQMIEKAMIFSPGSVQAEHDNFNSDHAIIGFMLTKSWGIDSAICRAIMYHHSERIETDLDREVAFWMGLLMLAENAILQLSTGAELLFHMPAQDSLMGDVCRCVDCPSEELFRYHEEIIADLDARLNQGG